MELVLTEICEYLNNYFWVKKIEGTFKIEDGEIEIAGLKEGQYFRIMGSTFNNGVHLYPTSDLNDEEFKGSVWLMAVPQTVISLAGDIAAWQDKFGQATSNAMSPFNSESFSGYSYSKNGSGGAMSWQDAFASRLNKYRKVRGIF